MTDAAPSPVELNVSIVNYRTAEMTLRCVETLRAGLGDVDAHVTIVDNASGDGSVERLEAGVAALPPGAPVSLVASPRNGGFSAGHNLGIGARAARFHLVLNSDALVRPGAARTLIDAMEADPGLGLAAPRLEREDGAPQISCFRLPSPASELIRGAATGPVTRLLARHDVPMSPDPDPAEIGWVSFACVLLRDAAIREVGPMDEGFFLYAEDTEYCARLTRAGWRLAYLPEARVAHLRGGSAPVKALAAERRRLPAYWYASRTRLMRLLHGRAGPLAANLAWHLGRGLARLRVLAGRPVPPAVAHEARDLWINVLDPLGDPRAPAPARER